MYVRFQSLLGVMFGIFCLFFRASTTSNPDVLGSIFTDLNTLYRKDVSLDKQGRLKVSDDPKDTKSESHSVGETSVSVTNASCEKQKPTSSSTANETSGRKVPIAEEHHAKSLLSRDNRDNRDNEDKKDNKGYHTEDSNSYVRKKRLSYFDTNARTSKGGTGHTLGTISRSRDSTTTTSGGSDKEPCVIDLMRKLKAREERNYVVTDTKSRETSSKPRLPKSLKDPAGATVLSSYKIPRKKSSSASGLSLGTRKEVPLRKESDDGWKQNPASNKARRTMTSKSVGYSQPNSGILHLLPETPLNGRNFHKTKSYIPSVSQSSTAPSGRNSQVQKTRLRITSDEQKSVSSVKVYESQRTKTPKPRSINNCEKNSASKSHFGSNCSKKTAFTKIHQKNCTTSTSTGKETVTNLSIIEMINQRKSVLSESEPDTTDNACSGTIVDIENADFDGQLRRPRSARILPPITSASSCTRPVAVVHPNTQRTPETSGTLSGADATKRRKEVGLTGVFNIFILPPLSSHF